MTAVDEVGLWLVRTAVPAAVAAVLARCLDEAERRRADRLDPALRTEYIAARGAFRVVVGRLLGTRPERVRWRIGTHGKPDTDRLRVSLSRSPGFAMIACTAHRAVGVDLQGAVMTVDPVRAAARYYPEAEARYVAGGEPVTRYTGLLSRKEACVKAAGGRLVRGLRVPVLHRALVHRPEGPYRVRDVPAPPAHAAAVALAGAGDFRVREHRLLLEREVETAW